MKFRGQHRFLATVSVCLSELWHWNNWRKKPHRLKFPATGNESKSLLYIHITELELHVAFERESHKGWGVAQVADCLPSKCKAPSSNPNTTKKLNIH
jgi:hypothetical protein